MKLKEMSSRPSKAGLAEIVYSSYRRETPHREGAMIMLPDNPDGLDFFPLKNGHQFLAAISPPPLMPGNDPGTNYWFGGTDEGPFLVQLRHEPYDVLTTKGEDAFFEALKPPVIRELEREFGVASRRQGDIWAVPLPFGWDELNRMFIVCGERNAGIDPWIVRPHPIENHPLFGTRHRLTGQGNGVTRWTMTAHNPPHSVYAEGIISAPDHSPMDLTGLHVLRQAEVLVRPNEAD